MKTKMTAMATLLLVALGCSKEVKQTGVQETAPKATTAADENDVAVPMGRDDRATWEQERLDEKWRELESLRDARAAAAQPAVPAMQITFAVHCTE